MSNLPETMPRHYVIHWACVTCSKSGSVALQPFATLWDMHAQVGMEHSMHSPECDPLLGITEIDAVTE